MSSAAVAQPVRSQGLEKKALQIEVVAPNREGRAISRRGEPVTVGIPLGSGQTSEPHLLALLDADGSPVPLQTRALDHWADGSIRWLLLDFQATVPAESPARYQLRLQPSFPPADGGARIRTTEDGRAVTIDTGVACFHARAGGPFPFQEVTVHGTHATDTDRTGLHVEDAAGGRLPVHVCAVSIEERGALRSVMRLRGTIGHEDPLLEFEARLHFFAGSATVRFVLTVRNPRPAGHRGGLWSLGSKGSVYVRDLSFVIALIPRETPAQIFCSPESDAAFEICRPRLELYQDSSGGQNWRSSNHVNRHGNVPHTFRGYRLRSGDAERSGLRATPVALLRRGDEQLGLTMPYFWQNFPKAMEASADTLTVRLFPRQYADVHEIQGGEQKTHTFVAAFGPDEVTEMPLAWSRAPLLARAAPSWYGSTGVVPYLTPASDDPDGDYHRLVQAAIEGPDTFEGKREVVDEYGWRHFGDIYADHEAIFQPDRQPLVSHYNNQYDALLGFGYQFLRTGDSRWWSQMDQLAVHVADIDIYHSDGDRAAYNHGLFWHTFHYVDAGTATHRTYPGVPAVPGGGPANEHNYSTGLILHYFLTGDPLSREAVLELAGWVLAMDDGSKSIFRWLAKGDTGLASSTASPEYHGPGRGAGHSISTLLNAHRLTGERLFLDKAEQLIARCIHPSDDIASRGLLDIETRWSYTVFLQVLGKYLDYSAERGDGGGMYAYARESLLHYARWMAAHERPYLEARADREHQVETWAAQDMRKSEAFWFAALHASGPEREQFRERAEFFFRASTSTLLRVPTRTFARAVVIMLSTGFMRAYFHRHPEAQAVPPRPGRDDFGLPQTFIPQKARAKRRLIALAGTMGALGLLSALYLAI